MAESDRSTASGESPLFGGSWRRLYLVVLGSLVFWIAAMALLTWAFA